MPAIRMSLIHDLAAPAGRDLDPSELTWMLDEDLHSAQRATGILSEHGALYGAGQPHYVPGVKTLDVARSTLRQALTTLTQTGHVHATRGGGGGTFVVDRPPVTEPPSAELLAEWRDVCDWRLSVELGVGASPASPRPLATSASTTSDG